MDLHKVALDQIQEEWTKDFNRHKERRMRDNGIRSSQISAMIAYLIKIGVITRENVFVKK